MYDDTRSTSLKTTTTTNTINTTTKTTLPIQQITTNSSRHSGCITQGATTTIKTTPANLTHTNLNTNNILTGHRPISVLTPTKVADPALLEHLNPAINTHMTLLTHRRRRFLQRHACLLSIAVAFIVGLVLGVLAPMLNMSQFYGNTVAIKEPGQIMHLPLIQLQAPTLKPTLTLTPESNNQTHEQDLQLQIATRPPSDFPTIYELQAENSNKINTINSSPYAVSFVKEQNLVLPAEEVFRNAFHLEQVKDKPNALLVKKLDTADGSIKEFQVERLSKGRFRKGPEKRLSKPSLTETLLPNELNQAIDRNEELSIVPIAQRILANAEADKQRSGIIKSDIYWGDLIEKALPQGFNAQDAKAWNHYVTSVGKVAQFENGCGRMQNRLIIFADGTKACARYRQNTDQIQGEIFSYYLGQLLNISNLAPSAATLIDLDSPTWSSALPDITQAQWKQQRPVVLTRWLADLEPAGIPQPFQPLERHLNKYDVWNITLNKKSATNFEPEGLLARLSSNTNSTLSPRRHNQSGSTSASTSSTLNALVPTPAVLQRLVELAQWSDLIVFDYLIANLDRVVNNLYNFQWNADIMAAPAHNLARQSDTQLLVFLDNESGLLHGYRLLKKYEAYHGVLLDNLCVFRQPTIEALNQLRTNGPGRMLREIFERTTSNQVRDVLPSLPDKSIKILVDRIDRVLGQVQKCKDLLSDR